MQSQTTKNLRRIRNVLRGCVSLPLLLKDILPICTVGWFTKTDSYVLMVQHICPVRQNLRDF